MMLVRRPQATVLGPFVESLGYAETVLPDTKERKVPTGTLQLTINLDHDEIRIYRGDDLGAVQRQCGAVLSGPGSEPYGIDTAEQRAVAWVAFRPGGAFPFLGVPSAELCDEVVDLGAVWARSGAVLRDRLLDAATPAAKLWALESALLSRAVRPLEPDRQLTAALAGLEHGRAVRTVVDEIGTTPKRLIDAFRHRVGLTPKRFSRVRRLQRLLGDARGYATPDWALLAASHGYADQPHLSAEFRTLTGVTPGAYLTHAAEQNHITVPQETTH